MNKTIKTTDVVSNNFFLPKSSLIATQSVLQNVDTSGMTKLQKKKLKKKLKKQLKGTEESEEDIQIVEEENSYEGGRAGQKKEKKDMESQY